MNLKTLLIYILGPLGAALIGFITLPILTWLYSPEIVGSYGLLNIGLSLVTLIFALGFDQAYVREFYNEKNHTQLLKSCVIPGYSFLLLTFIILGICYFLELFELSLSSLLAIFLAYVFVGFFSISNLFIGYYFRMHQNAVMYSLCQIIPKIGFLIFIVYFYLSGLVNGFNSVALAQFLSIIFLSLLMLFYTRHAWLPIFNEKMNLGLSKRLISFGFPLMLANLTFWALTSTDRLALTYFSDLTAVGIYSIGVSLALIAGILQVVFSAIWTPIIYRWEKEGFEQFSDQYDNLFKAISTVIFSVFCLVGIFAWLVDYVFPSSYSLVKYILVCCFAYPLFYTLSEVTVVGLHLVRKTFFVLIASCMALLINVILNVLLTPTLSITGAAIATAISFFALFVIRTELSIRQWRSFSRFKTYTIGVVIITLACLQALSNSNYIYWSFCWLAMLMVIVFLGVKDFKFIVYLALRK